MTTVNNTLMCKTTVNKGKIVLELGIVQSNKDKLNFTDVFPHPVTVATLPVPILVDALARVTIFAFLPKAKGEDN